LLTAGAPKLAKSSGKWYYEAELGRNIDETHIGWASRDFDGEGGVGRDAHGWAADGLRHLFWNNGATKVRWPHTWKVTDIIGCAIDIDAGEMIFFSNGQFAMPVPFRIPPGGCSIFPAVSARGEYTLNFTEATFKHFPAELGFKALMDSDEANSSYGCRGSFNRPGAQDEMPIEPPRQKGIRIYKDSPLQNSVVDQVVFGRDMDFSGAKQFSDGFMDMYKDSHGVKSVHTDISKTTEVSKTGIRTYASKPETRSVVHKIIEGHDLGEGDEQFDEHFLEMYDGAAGMPTCAKGHIPDVISRQGRNQPNMQQRFRWLQDAEKPAAGSRP